MLLIRHGQTPHNVSGALDTAIPGAGLSALGRVQAAAIPAALGEREVRAVYASRLIRTQQTAAPLAAARGLEVGIRPGLEEIGAGGLEMRTDPESRQTYAMTVASWIGGDLDRVMPGGPDGHEFWARYRETLDGIVAAHRPGDTVAVVTHGAAIRAFTALATGLPAETALEMGISNTGMADLLHDPDGGWSMVRWVGDPLGGAHLLDLAAHDITGESAEDAAHESAEG